VATCFAGTFKELFDLQNFSLFSQLLSGGLRPLMALLFHPKMAKKIERFTEMREFHFTATLVMTD
jgi:hypothetical protein